MNFTGNTVGEHQQWNRGNSATLALQPEPIHLVMHYRNTAISSVSQPRNNTPDGFMSHSPPNDDHSSPKRPCFNPPQGQEHSYAAYHQPNFLARGKRRKVLFH